MIDTIEALDAWWPPTFRPVGLGRTRLAWSMIAVDSHSTRRSIARRPSRLPVPVCAGSVLVTRITTLLVRASTSSRARPAQAGGGGGRRARLAGGRLPGWRSARHRVATMTDDAPIDPSVPPSGPGCATCLASDGWWFHLRRCAQCGLIGCCDSSPSQHASKHAAESGHRLIRSYEPGEDWFWDYVSEQFYDGPALADPQHHPLDQPVPGPAGKVPADWQRHLH